MPNITKLPVSTPLLSGYSFYGSIFSILATEGENYHPWLFSRFAQLIATSLEYNDGLYINIDEPQWFPQTNNFCPFIEMDMLSKKLFNKQNDIINSIIDAINNEYYVYMVVEQYYIPGSFGYQTFSFHHDIMIYGYDNEKQLLYFADNLKGKYQFSECHFTQFIEAYNDTDPKKDSRLNSKVCLFKKRKATVEFDPLWLVDNLNGYLTGVHPEKRSSQWHHTFRGWAKGLDIYKNVKYYLSLLKQGKIQFDIRGFFAIYEHKKIMVKRIEYMIGKGYLSNAANLLEEYRQIESISLLHVNSLLKYGVTGELKFIDRIYQDIDMIVEKEKRLIPEILENIQTKEVNEDCILLGLKMNPKYSWNLS